MTKIIDDSIGVQDFLYEIEKIKSTGVDYMDAVLHYCEKNEVEIESVAKYIKKNVVLKSKLQQEAEDLNYLQKISRLPI